MTTGIFSNEMRQSVMHAMKTAVASVVSLLAARLLHLPEAYWAPITTLVILQSSLGAALPISAQRFAGTVLGAAVGAAAMTYTSGSLLVFGLAVFVIGMLCTLLRLEKNAYRFASITVAIIMLVPRVNSAWVIALHRCIEVSVGIAVGLLITFLWPEPDQ